MKSNTCATVIGLMVVLVSSGVWLAPTNAQVREAKAVKFERSMKMSSITSRGVIQEVASSKPLRLPVYKPPKGIGAPGGRVGGGTRGDDSSVLKLFALVPDHLGLTIQEQPTLYWYLSNQTSKSLVLTVNHEDLVTPVLEITLADSLTPGIHSVSLRDHHIKLDLDKEYRWYVGLVVDVDYPSRNIVAGGRIKRILPPESLLSQLRKAEPNEVTAVYSESGLWYDAFDSISDLIVRRPGNHDYHKGRTYLLKQVDIRDIMEIAVEEDSVLLNDDSASVYTQYMNGSYAQVDYK